MASLRHIEGQQPQLPHWYGLFEKGLVNHLQMTLLRIWYCNQYKFSHCDLFTVNLNIYHFVCLEHGHRM